MPRVAMSNAGRSRAIMPLSKITAASAPRSSAARNSTIECPPVSSSPSQAKRTLTGSSPARASSRAAHSSRYSCPLSSATPRPYRYSPRISGSNGGDSHSSSGSGGWTSKWP